LELLRMLELLRLLLMRIVLRPLLTRILLVRATVFCICLVTGELRALFLLALLRVFLIDAVGKLDVPNNPLNILNTETIYFYQCQTFYIPVNLSRIFFTRKRK
jgi:hypothetical protein